MAKGERWDSQTTFVIASVGAGVSLGTTVRLLVAAPPLHPQLLAAAPGSATSDNRDFMVPNMHGQDACAHPVRWHACEPVHHVSDVLSVRPACGRQLH
jgi:hypothetical protein